MRGKCESDAVSIEPIDFPEGVHTSLNILATGVDGNQPNQTFTITYTDGTTSKFTQSLSDWHTPQNYAGETQAITMGYRCTANGTDQEAAFYLYSYSFSLAAGKTAFLISLPANRNVVVLAVTLL